jgi:hypothetical protein
VEACQPSHFKPQVHSKCWSIGIDWELYSRIPGTGFVNLSMALLPTGVVALLHYIAGGAKWSNGGGGNESYGEWNCGDGLARVSLYE